MRWYLLKAKRFPPFVFLGISALLLLLLSGLHVTANNSVYLVLLGDRELGVVEDGKDLEFFVDDLTARCSDLYGVNLELAEMVTLARVPRSDSAPDPETVREKIREQLEFVADAYLININGEPFVPVYSEDDLGVVVDSIKSAYLSAKGDARVLDVYVVEELALEACSASPDSIFTAEEVVALLTESEEDSIALQDVPDPVLVAHNSLDNRHFYRYEEVPLPSSDSAETGMLQAGQKPVGSEIKLNIKTVEELMVIESIDFPVEYVYDEKMLTTHNEITSPGMEGEKRVVYRITRENGVEIERAVINEEILEEPLTQIETKGLKEPPSIGTGQFVWPVRGDGIIYNGYRPGHTAIDIHIAEGTSVLAADAGLVTFSGFGSTQGNYLILYHGAYWTMYMHNSVNLVSKGERVSRGQVIARVGTTGRAIGAHLHFEVRADDGSGQWHSYYQHEAVNPMQFFRR